MNDYDLFFLCVSAMASGGGVGKEAIVSAIQDLRDTEERLLADARNDIQGCCLFMNWVTHLKLPKQHATEASDVENDLTLPMKMDPLCLY